MGPFSASLLIRADIDSPRGEKIWGRRVGWDPLLHYSGLWGCPGEVIYVGASFARTSRARAPRTAPFLGVNVYSAPRKVVSLVVTHQWCEKWASDATHSWKPSLPVYATSCMSIRPALQVVASPSEESIDPLGLQGKTRRGWAVRGYGSSLAPRSPPLCMQRGEFPAIHILGNSDRGLGACVELRPNN